MAVVAFDPTEFKTLYPKFKDTDDTTLTNYFSVAELFCDNTDLSMVTDVVERKKLLYLLVAHIATIIASGVVGILQGATEGKVTANFVVPTRLNWYKQSPYGYLFWTATQKYRLGGLYRTYSGPKCV